jgi:hypothetical protein
VPLFFLAAVVMSQHLLNPKAMDMIEDKREKMKRQLNGEETYIEDHVDAVKFVPCC